jgi:hypothetical protein
MGVKLLNTFIKSKFPSVIERKHWGHLKNKKIVVDANNYMYKFLSEENLVGGFIRMCDIFMYYNITPLFIFDGRAPNIKSDEIKKRKMERIETQKKCSCGSYCISNMTQKECIEMRRKMVTVGKDETEEVKKILDGFGMKYMKAPHESDELCCKLVNIGKVYACLSEDMDMFVYGCKCVLRDYGNSNYIKLYNINNILDKMRISQKDFRYLSLVSNMKKNIFEFYKIYNHEKNFVDHVGNKYLNNYEKEKINKLIKYYDINQSDVLSKCNYILIKLYNYNKDYISSLRRTMPPEKQFYPS